MADEDFGLEDDDVPLDLATANFQQAADYLPQLLAKVAVADEDLLYLYARFKHSIEGPCNTRRPGFLEFQAKKKWDAWNSIRTMSQNEAKLEYVNKIKQLDPSWEPVVEEKKAEVKKPKTANSWVSVSSMAAHTEIIPDEEKTIYDWCRDGNLDAVKRLLDKSEIDINSPDEIGLTLLHWSCDRGHIDICRYLIRAGADVNIIDPEGQTPLHYACSCGYSDIVKELLECHADIKIKDKQNETPVQVADDKIKKLISSWVFWRGSGEFVE